MITIRSKVDLPQDNPIISRMAFKMAEHMMALKDTLL